MGNDLVASGVGGQSVVVLGEQMHEFGVDEQFLTPHHPLLEHTDVHQLFQMS